MTKEEFKQSAEYQELMNRIKNYSIGFRFTMPYYKMTKGQENAIGIVLHDAVKQGIIESLSIGLDLKGNRTEEVFRRI